HRGSVLSQVARPDEAEFRMLAVDLRVRGKGIGEMLVMACIERAARPPLLAKSLVLWTRPSMTSAQRLYERLGFRRAVERDTELAARLGDGMERWVYVRAL
ncbi:MAG: GNAT family N-acetyltransferase, partial [Armatimonadota bacterium]